jgi:hypothetical protein
MQMMEITIRATNSSGLEVAKLTVTGIWIDTNSILSQFKVMLAPSDANAFEALVSGILKPGIGRKVATLTGSPTAALETENDRA